MRMRPSLIWKRGFFTNLATTLVSNILSLWVDDLMKVKLFTTMICIFRWTVMTYLSLLHLVSEEIGPALSNIYVSKEWSWTPTKMYWRRPKEQVLWLKNINKEVEKRYLDPSNNVEFKPEDNILQFNKGNKGNKGNTGIFVFFHLLNRWKI